MFPYRSYEKELLDGDGIPFSDIRQNMRELDFINQYLGGHRSTLAGFKMLAGSTSKPLSVVEIGCGGGDNLRVIQQWAARNRREVVLTGIDRNPDCIRFAQEQTKNKGIVFVCSDYRNVQFAHPPHIVFSSLFCHHFTDEELVAQLRWMQQHCTTGFFINDLHRHPLAYNSIKLLTRLFSSSYLVKNDAPLSVRRGFTRADWQWLFAAAEISGYTCTWKWAFRWLVVCNKAVQSS